MLQGDEVARSIFLAWADNPKCCEIPCQAWPGFCDKVHLLAKVEQKEGGKKECTFLEQVQG